MKLLITGDWHIRADSPRKRIDNYTETQFAKIQFILRTARSQGCTYILQPGDMTEHYPYPKVPYGLTQQYIRTFLFSLDEYALGRILTIFGQHDMNQHQGITNTPLWTMDAANAVWVISTAPELIEVENQRLYIYGHNYGTPIPEVRERRNCFNILLTHQMVSNRDYWQGHVDYTQARALLDHLTGYDLIVCGDNHNHFHEYDVNTRRCLINCGSLMRSTTVQRSHKPVVYVYDTIQRRFEMHKIPIAPPEEVFASDEAVTIRQGGEAVNPFVQEIHARRHGVGGMDFLETLRRVTARHNVNEQVERTLERILADATAQQWDTSYTTTDDIPY